MAYTRRKSTKRRVTKKTGRARSSYGRSGNRSRARSKPRAATQTVRIVVENTAPTDPVQALMEQGMKPAARKKARF